MERCGWYGKVKDFLKLNESSFIESLIHFIPDANELQIAAWKDCYHFLQDVFPEVISKINCSEWGIIFEYELPREGGRRPDVLILLPGRLVVLEFKMKSSLLTADAEQLTGYLRDLRGYHSAVSDHKLKVSGSIVLTKATDNTATAITKKAFYKITGENGLARFLVACGKNQKQVAISCQQFLDGQYEPLPTILEAARLILKNEPLPNIRKVNNTNIPNVITDIKKVIKSAKETKTNHLVLVTGVPGSGKTLVGLQLAHEEQDAIYLSGNGPLVNVIQDALDNRTLVQPLLNYKREYLSYGNIPSEHIIIFDEAQRAWDAEKMQKPMSEPDLIIEMAMKEKEWAVVVGLIGEGQEIHEGEESGLSLWNHAIKKGQWIVHSSNNLDGLFTKSQQHIIKPSYNLTHTLRSHAAIEWHKWVEDLFQCNFLDLRELTLSVMQNGLNLYLTRSLEKARTLVQGIYQDTKKQFGYLVSSKGYRRRSIPILEGKSQYIAYFNHPKSGYYSSRLNHFATEFQTQGLELDLGILLWGYDFRFENGQWVNYYQDRRLKNPYQIRENSYRVLLTRGRDGTVIVIPNDPILDNTYDLLVSLGIPVLK
jgi:hypothetical protein